MELTKNGNGRFETTTRIAFVRRTFTPRGPQWSVAIDAQPETPLRDRFPTIPVKTWAKAHGTFTSVEAATRFVDKHLGQVPTNSLTS